MGLKSPRAIALSLGLCLALAAPAWGAGMESIQGYVDSHGPGERDHGYPLMRCAALYLASLRSADVPEDKAANVMATAQKMIAIAANFHLQPGQDPAAVANGVMDKVEGMVADYGSLDDAPLVKQDFKYCRNFGEPFARNYQMARPEGEEAPVERTVQPSPPPAAPREQAPQIAPGDMPGAPLPD